MIKVKSKSEMRKKRHRRIRKKVFGTSECPRLVVFRSLKHIYAQVIDDVNGVTITSASTLEQDLSSRLAGKSRKEISFMVGKSIGKKAREKGITRVVFDRGGYKYHGRVAELARGAREAGLKF
ncbi:MAG: 50S ribosomal protein L18 [Candidatus Eremiobacteraeota bacterium]|nr:50S ribosomal protein L18 [Candidatus Eremiobacteraeota bacterium]